MGIFRHTWLTIANKLSVVPWGFFAPAAITGAIHSPGGAAAPQTADGVVLSPQLDVANAGAAAAAGSASFALLDAAGATVCSGVVPFNISAGGWVRLTATLACGSPAAPLRLWNTAPGGAALHTATATLLDGGGAPLDAVSARVGLRSAIFSPTEGFVLNGLKISMRGFSNHVGFGGCGGAVPDRVAEFMLTMLQSIGGNAYRTAHNPVAPECEARWREAARAAAIPAFGQLSHPTS